MKLLMSYNCAYFCGTSPTQIELIKSTDNIDQFNSILDATKNAQLIALDNTQKALTNIMRSTVRVFVPQQP